MPERSLFKLFDPVYYMWLVNILGSFVCCLKFWFSFRLVVLLLCYESDPSFVIQSSQNCSQCILEKDSSGKHHNTCKENSKN